ncbi:MAG TPA: hypothetical protein VHV83_22115, partial [Armatimonadota bacterium]|nr:hypothetical protein [Armatimonadota bacterium]
MRLACFFLLMLITAVGAIAQTEDLIQAVPTTNPAYAQVYQLNKVGIIPTLPEKLRKTDTPLTHYDIAFLLVEPLERCSAFVETQESPSTVLPEQRRRAEMAYLTFSKIAPEDFDRALTSLSQLLRAFGTDVELLSP